MKNRALIHITDSDGPKMGKFKTFVGMYITGHITGEYSAEPAIKSNGDALHLRYHTSADAVSAPVDHYSEETAENDLDRKSHYQDLVDVLNTHSEIKQAGIKSNRDEPSEAEKVRLAGDINSEYFVGPLSEVQRKSVALVNYLQFCEDDEMEDRERIIPKIDAQGNVIKTLKNWK